MKEQEKAFQVVEAHPDYTWKELKPCTFGDLGNDVQFVSIRKFSKNPSGVLTSYKKELALAKDHFGLGRVVWLHYPALMAKNAGEFLEHCAREGCFIFNVWGYLPGQAGEGGFQDFGEFQPNDAEYQKLLDTMGHRFLGYDVGEQDSRYLLIFSPLQCPFSMDRSAQYRNFYRFVARMRGDLRNHVSVLGGSSLIHHLAKEAGTQLIGVEALQIHMNINLWYGFVRGAGKQYGLLWFGNASVFNNFGFRDFCPDEVDAFGSKRGVSAGPSDSLLKQVFYVLFVYNSTILGFEHFLFDAKSPSPELSVCGQIQKSVMRIAGERSNRKRLHTPVAILTDFFQGWVPPRNMVNMDTHRVWGGVPYSMGDFQLTALFELFYPGYMDSAAYEDERGFLTETPFGDVCDILLSDCRPEVLDEYDLIILAGEVSINQEMAFKLRRFLKKGGRLIAATSVRGWQQITETTLRRNGVIRHGRLGSGEMTIIDIPHMLDTTKKEVGYVNRVNERCPLMYELHPKALRILVREIKRVVPLRIQGHCLATFSFNDRDKEAMMLVINTTKESQPLTIRCPHPVQRYRFLEGEGRIRIRKDGRLSWTLPPGGISLLKVAFRTPVCRRSSVVWDKPLPFRVSIKLNGPTQQLEEIFLRLPSFRNYFDGVTLTSDYFENMSDAAMDRDAQFLKSRGIGVHACDVTPAINHYPDHSLIGGGKHSTKMAMQLLEKILQSSRKFGTIPIILPSLKNGEIAFEDSEALRRIVAFFRDAAGLVTRMGSRLHLKPAPHRFFDSYRAMIDLLNDPQLSGCGIWLDIAHHTIMKSYTSSIKHGYPKFFEAADAQSVKEIKNLFYAGYQFEREKRDRSGLAALIKRLGGLMSFISLSSPSRDHSGGLVDAHLPVKGSILEKEIVGLVQSGTLNGKTLVLDLDADVSTDFEAYFEEW